MGRLLRQIADTPAATVAGLAIKAEAVRRELRDGISWHYLPLADGLVADAERLAGEAGRG